MDQKKKGILMRYTLILLGAVLFLFTGCGDDDDNGTVPDTGLHRLQLSFEGIEPLQNGYHYEGWAIVGGAPVSTGKFNVDMDGDLVDLSGNPIAGSEFEVSDDLADANAIVVTVEPDGDTDTDPADTHILAGSIAENEAALSVGHSAAIGDDFAAAAGDYILATPTNGPSTNEKSGIWFLHPPTTAFNLDFEGLAPLANDFHYEGWAIVDGQPVSTGKFHVDDNGDLFDLDGAPITDGRFVVGGDLSSATAIVLTIEPGGDTDAVPADTHYLAGDVSGAAASLAVGHAAALGDDFAAASGDYILATPTNGAETNENSGIWFLSLESGSPALGLTLPTLPAGWEYEGWVVIDGTPVTSGKFTEPADFDDAAPYSGSEAGPPFPGEDYLNNAPNGLTFPTDLAGGTAVISVEPSPDDDAGPFALKPLVGSIPADATDHLTYSMDLNTDGLPTGTAMIEVMSPTAGLTLPTLPAGWDYEGWVVIDGTPVTSGKFTDLSAADDSAPYSGTEAGPPFPGEDYLNNAPAGLTFPTDLSGGTVVVSIEPSPDDDSSPFALKPLVGNVPNDAQDHFIYEVGNNAAGFPTGTASLSP